ncbi:hypothetical protein Hanom_Chr03g00257081 [Helianthus anomalus]
MMLMIYVIRVYKIQVPNVYRGNRKNRLPVTFVIDVYTRTLFPIKGLFGSLLISFRCYLLIV